MTARRTEPGELALVLHTHMPYVEGFGTWPFGEEWLWEAIATSYLPLLDVLAAPGGESVTVSLTPVLADQLELPEAMERCLRFLEGIRPESHRLDVAELAAGHSELAAELERSAAEYAAAARRLRELTAGGGLLRRLGAPCELDLIGHPRDPAPARQRCRRAVAGANRRGGAPAPVRRLAGRVLATRVRPRSVA